nr:Swt1 family HEPN domain-containing protein [Sphingomonas vulcanisoli]
MRILATRPKLGAFGAIEAFENGLRAFVAAKLAPAHGAKWFVQRVPGDIVGRAKERRREAMRSGEAALDLIFYTDLGDLLTIIVRRDNWSEHFEAVFDRAEWLRVDLERLTAYRRPTMHSRPIEPPLLCEIVFIIRRLVGWMERDGIWDHGWDADA